MRPDHEFADGLKLGAIAIVSAAVTAMVVIGAGRALLPDAPVQAQTPEQHLLLQASLP